MAGTEYIASDVHLGAVPPETERAFVAFLEHVGQNGASLLLAGDLFDFWFEYGSVIQGRHYRVLAALSRLVDAGIAVTLIGGNHDFWGGRFLREEVGLVFHENAFRTRLAGRPALVAHGDGLGRGDLRYRVLKTIIRSRPAVVGFRALHPELGMRIARAVSSTEARPDADLHKRGRARFIEEWARGQLAADPSLAWVVCGHSHIPALVEVEAGRYYVNAGDWLTHFTFVTIDAAGAPGLKQWPAPGASPRATTASRREG